MKLIDDQFPFVLFVPPHRYDKESLTQMDVAFRGLFRRGRKFGLLVVPPAGQPIPNANERKLVGDWANSEAIRENSKLLCSATAVVVPSALARGALTAILWLWKPPCPLELVEKPEQGADYILLRLMEAGLMEREGRESAYTSALARLGQSAA